MADEGGIKWKCKSRQKKNKGDSKKCKGKCPPGFFSTAPKKVRCDEGIGWMTKKQGPATIAATTGTCVSLKKIYLFFEHETLGNNFLLTKDFQKNSPNKGITVFL